jgi:amino acid transporter
MVSAEAKRPRVYIKAAFKTVYIRLAIFFVGGSLCAGIVVAYNVRAEAFNSGRDADYV